MDFRVFYSQHVALVWRALFRLGIATPDLPDAVKEVFMVAFRELPNSRAGPSPAPGWWKSAIASPAIVGDSRMCTEKSETIRRCSPKVTRSQDRNRLPSTARGLSYWTSCCPNSGRNSGRYS